MSKIRCLECGSSKWDADYYKCGRCGGAMAVRWEPCYVSEEVEDKLNVHVNDLHKSGVEVEWSKLKYKSVDSVALVGLVLTCADSLRDGILRDLVIYLRDELLIPEREILRLRLDEPEKVLTYCRMDQKDS